MKWLLGLVAVVMALVVASGCSRGGPESSPAGTDVPSSEPATRDSSAAETIRTPEGSYTRLEPQRLRTFVEEQDALVINTHVPYEGELPGTDRFIPYDLISESDGLPEDRDAPVAVYCRSGPMSQQAAETLVALGYTDVQDLRGGMDAWQEAGLPLRTKDR